MRGDEKKSTLGGRNSEEARGGVYAIRAYLNLKEAAYCKQVCVQLDISAGFSLVCNTAATWYDPKASHRPHVYL